MKAGFFKRGLAYIIDVLIISMVSSIVLFLFPYSSKVESYQNDLDSISKQLIESKISITNYTEQTKEITYKIERNTILYTVVEVSLIILYFGIFQFKNNGMTIGKKITAIKVVKDDGKLSINDLIIRSFFTTSLAINLISLATIMIFSKNNYLIINEVISALDGLLIIIIIFMILYRKDKKGLHDIILKTSVIEFK